MNENTIKPPTRYTLALDMALITGYAISVGGSILESGTVDLTKYRVGIGKHNGHAFMALHDFICSRYGDGIAIAYEVPHHRGGPATRLGVGWQTVVLMFSAQLGIKTLPVHTMTLKKFITGTGKADKQQMISEVIRRTGITPKDDNEADAIAVALYAIEHGF